MPMGDDRGGAGRGRPPGGGGGGPGFHRKTLVKEFNRKLTVNDVAPPQKIKR
jgi:hypothetical protein